VPSFVVVVPVSETLKNENAVLAIVVCGARSYS
jgi:hypothetical protein